VHRKKRWNQIFGPAEKWSEAFKNNKSLIHLDISNNGIDSKEIEIMAKGLN